MSTDQPRPSPQVVLESEYHSGEPCDCYPPDRDRPAQECVVWAQEILHALSRAGYTVAHFGPPDDPADYSALFDYDDDQPAQSDPSLPRGDA